MKTLIASIVFYSFALYLVSELFRGVVIKGGLPTLFLGGAVFTVLTLILKPILNAITFPLKIITFGAIAFLIDAALLFVLTLVVHNISIHAFTLPKIAISTFSTPSIYIPQFFAFLLVSVIISIFNSFLLWLTEL